MIYDIGTKNLFLVFGRESKCESSGFLFFIAQEPLVRGRNFSSRGTLDDAGREAAGRSSDEVAEQGDEVHLAEGTE